MGSQMEHDYTELQSGRWAEANPSKCPCKGRGWLLSNLDTWHKCPLHGAGVPHPEAEEEFNAREHSLRIYRQAAVRFRMIYLQAGGSSAERFKFLVVKALRGQKVTPVLWVDAAEKIAGEQLAVAQDALAKRRGFGSTFEMNMADEAARERRDVD